MSEEESAQPSRMTTRYRWFEILEVGAIDDPVSRIVDKFIVALILANVAAVILETVPELYSRFETSFLLFEYVSVAIFTVEYIRLNVKERASHP